MCLLYSSQTSTHPRGSSLRARWQPLPDPKLFPMSFGLMHIEYHWLPSQVPCSKYQGLFFLVTPTPPWQFVPSYLFTKDSSPSEFPSMLAVDLGSCVQDLNLQGMAEDFYTLCQWRGFQTEWGQVYGPEGHHNVQKFLVGLRYLFPVFFWSLKPSQSPLISKILLLISFIACTP